MTRFWAIPASGFRADRGAGRWAGQHLRALCRQDQGGGADPGRPARCHHPQSSTPRPPTRRSRFSAWRATDRPSPCRAVVAAQGIYPIERPTRTLVGDAGPGRRRVDRTRRRHRPRDARRQDRQGLACRIFTPTPASTSLCAPATRSSSTVTPAPSSPWAPPARKTACRSKRRPCRRSRRSPCRRSEHRPCRSDRRLRVPQRTGRDRQCRAGPQRSDTAISAWSMCWI